MILMNEKELLASISELFEQQNERIDKKFDKIDRRFEQIDQKVEQMNTALAKLQINQEGIIMPRLDLLFEGHTSILEKMQHDTRLQQIQDRVDTLESAVKYLSTELKHLKKAE